MLLGHGHMASDSRKLIFLDVAWKRWMGHVSTDCARFVYFCQHSTASIQPPVWFLIELGIRGTKAFHMANHPKSDEYRLMNWRKPQDFLHLKRAHLFISCCHLEARPGRWRPCHFATDPRARRCWLGATGCLLRAEPGRGWVDLNWHCKTRRHKGNM